MNIVIISRNQADFIERMWECVRDAGNALFVFDRCSDASERLASLLGIPYISNDDGEGRMTSTARNLGYAELKRRHGLQDTLFLDGDRHVAKGDLLGLADSDTDIKDLLLEKDYRDDYTVKYLHGTISNQNYSCGIFFKADACRKIEGFYEENRDIYGDSLIFPQNVEKYWGVEDTHLGDICYHLDLSVSVYEGARLSGKFDKHVLDDIEALVLRLRLQSRLRHHPPEYSCGMIEMTEERNPLGSPEEIFGRRAINK